jgi:hypothetical protein
MRPTLLRSTSICDEPSTTVCRDEWAIARKAHIGSRSMTWRLSSGRRAMRCGNRSWPQLAPRPDFAEERFFYSVRSINEIGCDDAVNAEKNTFKLRPARDYELRLYHYYPSEGNVEAEIRASATGAPLEFTVTRSCYSTRVTT